MSTAEAVMSNLWTAAVRRLATVVQKLATQNSSAPAPRMCGHLIGQQAIFADGVEAVHAGAQHSVKLSNVPPALSAPPRTYRALVEWLPGPYGAIH